LTAQTCVTGLSCVARDWLKALKKYLEQDRLSDQNH
jgi:hypothetical protein